MYEATIFRLSNRIRHKNQELFRQKDWNLFLFKRYGLVDEFFKSNKMTESNMQNCLYFDIIQSKLRSSYFLAERKSTNLVSKDPVQLSF